jgi:hypothetical protein
MHREHISGSFTNKFYSLNLLYILIYNTEELYCIVFKGVGQYLSGACTATSKICCAKPY